MHSVASAQVHKV